MDFLPFGVSLFPAVPGKCVNKALPPREGHGLHFEHREGSREGYLGFIDRDRDLREGWKVSTGWDGDSFHPLPVAQAFPAAKSIIPGTLGTVRAFSSSPSPREVCWW